jgi:hypothetical protein
VHTHEVLAVFGLELGAQVTQLNDNKDRIWLEAVQTQALFRMLGFDPVGHCRQVPYLIAPGWH